MNAVTAAATSAFLVVYLAALTSKVRTRAAFEAFSRGLAHFGITQRRVQRAVAVLVVFAEGLVLAALVVPLFGPGHRATPATVLTAGLTLASTRAARGRPSFVCHCFGGTRPTRVRPHVAVNLVLITLGLAGVVLGPAASSAGELLLGAGSGLIAGTVAVTRPLLIDEVGGRAPSASMEAR